MIHRFEQGLLKINVLMVRILMKMEVFASFEMVFAFMTMESKVMIGLDWIVAELILLASI